MYAGALGDNAVERYALFLTSLELSADIDERKMALTRAREHGLDMERVAVATAERTIDKAFEASPGCSLSCIRNLIQACNDSDPTCFDWPTTVNYRDADRTI